MTVILVKPKDLPTGLQDFAPGIVQKDAIASPNTEKMAVSYYEVEPGAPEMNIEMPFEEIDIVIEGSATLSDETGRTYILEKGDVFSITKGTRISFSSKAGFKGIAIIHPCNWKELMPKEE
jgi:ethanolamine utilization protein EutQ (cupin superfamily)